MPDYKYLMRMTDESGILQFSKKDNPDPSSGYTLDDNARALLVSLSMGDKAHQYASYYVNYMQNAQRKDGSWSNLLINNLYIDSFDSQDSIGRAIMTCSLAALSPWNDINKACANMIKKSLPLVNSFMSPRAISYVLIGLCKGKIPLPQGRQLNELVTRLSSHLINLYQKKHDRNWLWFEDYLTYCNGIMPHALFSVYSFNNDKKILKIACESLNFLNNILFNKGYLNIIGNQGWYTRGGSLPLFDQQPVDAASIALACLEAYEVMGKDEYLYLARTAHRWYRGLNLHGISLYNEATGGCYDALTSEGVNLNQGAEAILSLLLTDQAMEQNKFILSPIDLTLNS